MRSTYLHLDIFSSCLTASYIQTAFSGYILLLYTGIMLFFIIWNIVPSMTTVNYTGLLMKSVDLYES